MKISAVNDKNICAVNEKVLQLARAAASVKNNPALDPVLVLVPDRFTLQAEKILLVGGGCLLNCRVLTFSMLYNLVHEELAPATQSPEPQTPVLDKTTAVLFIWRAVQAVRGELLYFGRSADQYAFAEKMFNTINQLTSCMADFNNLEKNSAGDITRRKMHDIALVYKTYRELTTQYTDAAGMLGYLIANVSKSPTMKSAHVFVTGFCHLSVQRAEVVRRLAQNAKSFTAGIQDASEFMEFMNELRFAM